jgi:hypothetical protein
MAGGLLMLAVAQNASAQVVDQVEFTTSFPFTVGTATVPAGSYTIRPDQDNPNIFQLSGAHTGVLFETTDARAPQTPAKTEVVFKRYGNAYVLKNIYEEGSNIGAETTVAEAEHHLTKTSASATEHRIAATRKSSTTKAKPTSQATPTAKNQ